eukprot:1175498-Amphidinium_carterae.1
MSSHGWEVVACKLSSNPSVAAASHANSPHKRKSFRTVVQSLWKEVHSFKFDVGLAQRDSRQDKPAATMNATLDLRSSSR